MGYTVPKINVSNLLNAGSAARELFGSVRQDELANAKMAEEQRRYDEDRAWKLEDRERVAKERQAEDAYYGELAKGVQTKGGIYGDALATEANKYALNPDEILRATLYKNDANAARAAGDSTLADKLAWQTKVSDDVAPFMQSGVGEESRPEMYDRINSMVGSQGLPIPKEAILSADQARLAEKTATESAAKALKEAKADILKSDQANAWKLVNALGNTSTVIDENGNEVQVKGPSASVQNRNNTSFNNDVDKGITDILKTIEDKAKGTESTSKAVVSDQAINLYTTLIRDQGISPEVASKLVSSGVGSEEAGWKSLWLGDPKAKLTKDQLSTILPSAMSAMELKKDAIGGTTSTVKGNDKQEAATNLIAALNAQNKTQLGSILEEQAKLVKGSEGRRADSVNAWLQDKGLIDAPKAVVENAAPIKTNGGETRADRNNNPGNLTGDDKWQGMVGKDGRFVQFQSYELGSRALAKNLMNGAVGKTVEDYMNKYAPKSENDTNAYIKNVSKALGKEPGSVITDKDILPLMKVIAKQEGGKVDEKGLEAGYKMATGFSGKEFDATKESSKSAEELLEGSEQSNPKGLSILDTVKASELKPSADIKKDIDMLNSSLQKYKNIDEVPSTELDALKVLSDNYSLALKKEKLNKSSKDPFYKNFNWGRNIIGYGETKYNVSDEEKKLRASKENPNASVEEAGLEDVSLDLVGGKIVTNVVPKIKKFVNRNTIDEYLDVDQSTLQSIFGKYSPNVQGINRSAGITRDEIISEMVKLRELKNPSKYDLQELQRLNALLGRFTKSTSTLKPEL